MNSIPAAKFSANGNWVVFCDGEVFALFSDRAEAERVCGLYQQMGCRDAIARELQPDDDLESIELDSLADGQLVTCYTYQVAPSHHYESHGLQPTPGAAFYSLTYQEMEIKVDPQPLEYSWKPGTPQKPNTYGSTGYDQEVVLQGLRAVVPSELNLIEFFKPPTSTTFRARIPQND